MKARVSHKDALLFQGDVGGQVINIDGNGKAAPRPLEYILTSLAGCTSMSIISILNKMHIEIRELSAEVEGNQNNDTPRIFSDINVVYSIYGKVERTQVENAISLTFAKYSPTAVMLMRSGVKITYSYNVYE